MKRLLIILSILLLAGCSDPEPQPNQIRFVPVNSLPVITADLNGKSARLLIDTGATQSVLDETSKGRFGFKTYIKRNKHEHFHGIGGKSDIHNVVMATVTYRDSLINAEFLATDLSSIRKEYGIVGIIGSDWLKSRKAIIDYSTNLITVPNDKERED